MTTIINALAVLLIVVSALAVLAALALAIGALLPFFRAEAARQDRPVTIDNAADIWEEADKKLRTTAVDWDDARPAMRALAQLEERDLAIALIQLTARAS